MMFQSICAERRSGIVSSAVAALTSLTAFTGCSGGDAVALPENVDDAVANYAAIVLASYEDSLSSAQAMDTAIDAFIAAPTPATQLTAQQAWLAAREPYLQTEVYRFYDGPIDNPDDGPEGALNAWPMDESYVDYVDGMPNAGIVNDTSVTLDASTLSGLNEVGGEENVATGYHPIEFMLWGQDMSDSGPGARPSTDFLTVAGTAANQDRRGQYLGVVSDQLLADLTQVRDQWAMTGDYRALFLAADPMDSLEKILTGMIILSGFETGGERLQTALDSGDQEDEHSCFSDNTHRDMVGDVLGIQNVWAGEYGSIDGVGIRDVVNAYDSELAARLTTEIQAAVTAAEALQPPFDQEIASGNTEGNARVQALITALRTVESSLTEVFTDLGLSVEIPE